MTRIEFALTARFGGFHLNALAAVPAGGITAIMGPSGAGKTTLLRSLAGLSRAEGRVTIGDVVWQDARTFLPTHRRGVGYVFQEPSLLPHLSVSGNLAFAARRAGERLGPDFDDVVAMLGLGPLLERAPERLSGGERQRVAIGRALLSKPALLLMDEPLSSLDAEGKAEVLPYLDRLHRELDLPILYVSHDAAEVASLADRVLRMDAGRLAGPFETHSDDPLALLSDAQVKTLARAAIAAGLDPGG